MNNYENMTDRQLDALIAERVMGWALSKREGFGWPCKARTVPPVKYTKYSTYIFAAWQVAEKMKANGLRMSIDDFDNRYRVNFSPKSGWKISNTYFHINVPRAICIAALIALDNLNTSTTKGG